MNRDRFVHVGHLQKAAVARKPSYLDAHMKVGKIVQIRGTPFVQLSDADYTAIGKEFALMKKPAVVVPQSAPKPAIPAGGLGDAIHKVAGPIGRAIKWPCMKGDGTTDLKPDSPCDRARKLLNKL
jgi:hypothetical protein